MECSSRTAYGSEYYLGKTEGQLLMFAADAGGAEGVPGCVRAYDTKTSGDSRLSGIGFPL